MLQKASIQCPLDSVTNVCVSCLKGKFTKLPFQSSDHLSVTHFQIIHSDLWGPSLSISIDDYKYYVIFINDFSRYCWLYPLVNKNDLCSIFVTFYHHIQTQFSHSIQILQSDGGC